MEKQAAEYVNGYCKDGMIFLVWDVQWDCWVATKWLTEGSQTWCCGSHASNVRARVLLLESVGSLLN